MSDAGAEEEEVRYDFSRKDNRLNWKRILDIKVEDFLSGSGNIERLDDLYLPLVTSYVDLTSHFATPENLVHLFRVTQLVAELQHIDLDGQVDEAKDLQQEVDSLKTELAAAHDSNDTVELIEQLKTAVSDAKDKEKRLEQECTEKDGVISQLRVQNTHFQEQIERMGKEHTELEKMCSDLKDEIASIRDQESKMKSLKDSEAQKTATMKSQLATKNKQIDKYLQELNALSTSKSELESQLKVLQQTIIESEEKIERLGGEVHERKLLAQEATKRIEDLEAERLRLHSLLALTEKRVHELETQVVHVVDKFSHEAHQMVDEHEAAIMAKESEIETLKATVNKWQLAMTSFKTQNLEGRIGELEAQLAAKSAELESLRSGKKQSAGNPASVATSVMHAVPRSAHQSAEDSRTIASLKADLDIERRRLERQQQELVSKDEKALKLVQRIAKFEAGTYGMREAQAEIRLLEEQLQFRDRDVGDLVGKLNTREAQLEDLANELQTIRARYILVARSKTKGGDDLAAFEEQNEQIKFDVASLKLENQLEIERLRALKTHLEKEIERLEQERRFWLETARTHAVGYAEKAIRAGMPADQLRLLDDLVEQLREGKRIEFVKASDGEESAAVGLRDAPPAKPEGAPSGRTAVAVSSAVHPPTASSLPSSSEPAATVEDRNSGSNSERNEAGETLPASLVSELATLRLSVDILQQQNVMLRDALLQSGSNTAAAAAVPATTPSMARPSSLPMPPGIFPLPPTAPPSSGTAAALSSFVLSTPSQRATGVSMATSPIQLAYPVPDDAHVPLPTMTGIDVQPRAVPDPSTLVMRTIEDLHRQIDNLTARCQELDASHSQLQAEAQTHSDLLSLLDGIAAGTDASSLLPSQVDETLKKRLAEQSRRMTIMRVNESAASRRQVHFAESMESMRKQLNSLRTDGIRVEHALRMQLAETQAQLFGFELLVQELARRIREDSISRKAYERLCLERDYLLQKIESPDGSARRLPHGPTNVQDSSLPSQDSLISDLRSEILRLQNDLQRERQISNVHAHSSVAVDALRKAFDVEHALLYSMDSRMASKPDAAPPNVELDLVHSRMECIQLRKEIESMKMQTSSTISHSRRLAVRLRVLLGELGSRSVPSGAATGAAERDALVLATAMQDLSSSRAQLKQLQDELRRVLAEADRDPLAGAAAAATAGPSSLPPGTSSADATASSRRPATVGVATVAEATDKIMSMHLERLRMERHLRFLESRAMIAESARMDLETSVKSMEEQHVEVERSWRREQLRWDERAKELQTRLLTVVESGLGSSGTASAMEAPLESTVSEESASAQTAGGKSDGPSAAALAQLEEKLVRTELQVSDLQMRLEEKERELVILHRRLEESTQSTATAEDQAQDQVDLRMAKMAQQTISSLQMLVARKDEAIAKYQVLLQQERDTIEGERRRMSARMEEAMERMHRESDSQIQQLKTAMTAISSSASNFNAAANAGGAADGHVLLRGIPAEEVDEMLFERDKKIGDLQSALDAARTEIAALQDKATQYAAQIRDLQEKVKIAAQEAPAAAAKRQIQLLQKEMKDKEVLVRNLQAAIAELREEMLRSHNNTAVLSSSSSSSSDGSGKPSLEMAQKMIEMQDRLVRMKTEVEAIRRRESDAESRNLMLEQELAAARAAASTDAVSSSTAEGDRRLQERMEMRLHTLESDKATLERKAKSLEQDLERERSQLVREKRRADLLEKEVATHRESPATKPKAEKSAASGASAPGSAPAAGSEARARWEEQKKLQKQMDDLRLKLKEVAAQSLQLEKDKTVLAQKLATSETRHKTSEEELSRVRAQLQQLATTRIDLDSVCMISDLKRQLFTAEEEIGKLRLEVEKSKTLCGMDKAVLTSAEQVTLRGQLLETQCEREALAVKCDRLRRRCEELDSLNSMLVTSNPQDLVPAAPSSAGLSRPLSAASSLAKTPRERELTQVVSAMQKVIEKLQQENENMKKTAVSNVKYMEAVHAQRQSKKRVQELEAELVEAAEKFAAVSGGTPGSAMAERMVKVEAELASAQKRLKAEKEMCEQLRRELSQLKEQQEKDAAERVQQQRQPQPQPPAEPRPAVATEDAAAQTTIAEPTSSSGKGPADADTLGMVARIGSLERENAELRRELDAFDADFFNEIFDLKQRYKEAVDLLREHGLLG